MPDFLALIPDFLRTPVIVPVVAVYVPAVLLVAYGFLAGRETPYEPDLEEQH